MNREIDEVIESIFEASLSICNRVISQTGIYGIELMDITDPNIHELEKKLCDGYIPLLKLLLADGNVDPNHSNTMINIGQSAQYLTEIACAVRQFMESDHDNPEARAQFSRAADKLKKQAIFI